MHVVRQSRLGVGFLHDEPLAVLLGTHLDLGEGELGGDSIDILGTKLGTILGRVPERIPVSFPVSSPECQMNRPPDRSG